jgi:CRP/FNR family cyclic AMP-dependent transcriptional regulator
MSVAPAELAGHAFLHGLSGDAVTALAETASLTEVPAGHRFFEEGGRAGKFWLIRTGRVALDLTVPGRSRFIVETLGAGDELGLSWLSPSPEWQFGACAQQPVSAFELDGGAVRGLCDADPVLGYELTRRILAVAVGRLQATRIRMLDLYGAPGLARPS